MAPPTRTPVPVGARRRLLPWTRSRRVSALVVVATVLALGGAVAAVYTTGVTLGARIAPSDEADARTSGSAPDRRDDPEGREGSSTTVEGEDGSLPDRVDESTTSTGPSATATDGGTGVASGSPQTEPVEPYPGVWPYVSWQEVLDHAARGDDRYRTPSDTALRFAAEVVGVTGASIGSVDERGVVAVVEIRTGGGSTLVTLTRATPGTTTAATPWSVVEATGAVSLDVPPSVTGATLAAATSGRPGVVGVHDRSRWRGIGVAPSIGAPFEVRLDPGSAGPVIAVAVAGDPRAPSSFTMRRVQLAAGAGASAPAAPADPIASTRALVTALAEGDVGATWELLDPAARRSVLDWRGLAGRIPALREHLSLFASGTFTTTTVTTPAGPVSVVAPELATDLAESGGPLAALAFRVDSGARLASTEAGAVSWTGPSEGDASLLASGPTRPLVLVVDGAVWPAQPDGATGLRAPTDAVAPGLHLAIAVSVDGEQVTASAYPFVVAEPLVTPSTPTEPTTTAPTVEAPAGVREVPVDPVDPPEGGQEGR